MTTDNPKVSKREITVLQDAMMTFNPKVSKREITVLQEAMMTFNPKVSSGYSADVEVARKASYNTKLDTTRQQFQLRVTGNLDGVFC